LSQAQVPVLQNTPLQAVEIEQAKIIFIHKSACFYSIPTGVVHIGGGGPEPASPKHFYF
jgi:hypothetical protein